MKTAIRILVLLAASASGAFAHEVRPAYLELRQTGPETYDALWKVPGLGDELRLGLYVELPAGCTNVSEPRGIDGQQRLQRTLDREVRGRTDRRHDSHRRSRRDDDRRARAPGTSRRHHAGHAPHAVRAVVRRRSRAPRAGGRPHVPRARRRTHSRRASITCCSCSRCSSSRVAAWRLVKTVTAFTVAHSLTLTGATLGFVHVPRPPVEAAIALSIVFVAAEIVRSRHGGDSIDGASSVDRRVHLRPDARSRLRRRAERSRAAGGNIPTALLFFSVGVETGQFLFIGVVLSVIALVSRAGMPLPRWTELVPPYAIGAVAMFWVIQRTVSFFLTLCPAGFVPAGGERARGPASQACGRDTCSLEYMTTASVLP